MMSFSLPSGYSRVRRVASFEDLVSTPFEDGVNALCWERELVGDFAELAAALKIGDGLTSIDESSLQGLPLSDAGQVALAFLLEDIRRLRDQNRDPVLNGINAYPRDEDPGPVATDVYSFHADSAPVEADTWLCTYHGAPSEGLRQEGAARRVENPETRSALLKLYGGKDDDGFAEFLRDGHYDLHYEAVADSLPFSFGLGNLWRIAVDWPGSQVPPCVHRAPCNRVGDPVRLLMIC